MLSRSELTSRLLAALPTEAAATANRLICLEPDFQSACREPDFLRALLQRDDVAETTAWRPAALGLVALTQSTESDIGDGLAWLTTTNPGRNYALGALTQLTAPEADPVRRLASLVAVAAEVRRRFFDSAGDWLPVLHATLDRATEMPAGVLYCLYGIVDSQVELVRALVADGRAAVAAQMILVNSDESELENNVGVCGGKLQPEDALTLGLEFSGLGLDAAARAIAAAAKAATAPESLHSMPAAAAFGHRIRRAAQRAGAATLDSLAGSPRAFEDLAAALQATLNVGAMLATQLGRHALAHGDAVTARAALEQALALGDDDLDMLPDLAAAHVALGHPRDALQQLSDVSERDLPLTHALRVGLARTQALHALGDEDGARRALDTAARACGSPTGTPLQADDIPILRSLAEQASQLERPDLSAHFLQHVVTLHPTSVSAYTALAHAFVAVGEITAARSAALSALSLAPAKAHAHSLMASTLMQTADDAAANPKQALKHWQRAAELTPDDLEVLIGLAQSATQAGQAKLGLTSAERALELAEGAAASDGAVEALQDLQGRAHTALAEALEAMDDREGAFEHFQCATAACPTAPEAWRAVAQHHLRRDERRRALAALEAGRQAVGTANPVGAAALLGDLAQLQLDSQQPTEAIDTYRTASQLHPRNAEYRSRLGKLLLAQGQLEEGIASLREAARLSPAQPALWHDLGQALEEDGRDGEALGALEQALSAGGSSFSLAQDIGRLALRLGRHDLARPALLEAAESPHATADTFALLGSLHETAGEFEVAINAYERVLAMQPERNDILVRLGVCSLQAGRPSAAIATLRGAAEQDLEDLALQTTLAEAYLQEGLLEEAALSFEHAARLAPDDSRIWRKLAETARRAGDLKSAISALEHAVQLSPDRAELMAALGELYAGAERWEAARDMLLQALEIDDSRPQTHASLGRCLLALGDRDGGMAAYEQAAMLAPGDLAIFQLLAQAHEESGDFESAHSVYLRAVDACEEVDAPPEARADLLRRAGEAQWTLGRPTPAIALWQRALRYTPDDMTLLGRLGDALLASDRYEEGLQVLEHAASCEPGRPEHHCNVAAAARKAGDVARAIRHLRRALDIAPEDAALHHELGTTLLEAGDAQNALEQLKHAQRLDDSNARTISTLGAAYASLGDLPTARDHVERALRLAPDDEEVLFTAGKVQLQSKQYPLAIESLHRLSETRPDKRDYLVAQARARVQYAEERAAGRSQDDAHGVANKQDRKELGRVLGILDRAAALPGDNLDLVEWRGRAHAAIGDPEKALALLEPLTAAAPRPEILTARAAAYRRNDKIGLALESAKAALNLSGSHVPALVEYGRAAHKQGKIETSVSALKRAAALEPDNAAAHYWLAEALATQGELDQAEKSMSRALQLAPDRASWQHRLADIYRQQGRRSAALAHDQRAVHLAEAKGLPRQQAAQYRAALAELFSEDGDARAARREYEAALELVDDNAAWLTAAGNACLQTGDATKALEYFDLAIARAPTSVSPLIGATEALLALGRPREAESRITTAVRNEPDNAVALVALGQLYAQRGDTNRALDAYERAAEHAADRKSVLQAVAKLLLDTGRAEDALEVVGEALVSNSTDAELWALQGDAYHALSDPDNALQAYRQASEAAPLVARHHLRQGQLCRETGHLDQALVHFNRAVELQQTPAEGALAHFEIARIFETRRQLDRALQAYQDAIARDSANPDYLFHAGLVQKQVGDYTSAEQLFDRSVRLDRKNLEARRQLAAVKALRLINESPVAAQM